MVRYYFLLTVSFCLIGVSICVNKPSTPSRWTAVLADAIHPAPTATAWVDTTNPNSFAIKLTVNSPQDSTILTDLFVNGIGYHVVQNTTGAYSCVYNAIPSDAWQQVNEGLHFMDSAQFAGIYRFSSGSDGVCELWHSSSASNGRFVGGCWSGNSLISISTSLEGGKLAQGIYFEQFAAGTFDSSIFSVPQGCTKYAPLKTSLTKLVSLFSAN